jgi:hypothetical protein
MHRRSVLLGTLALPLLAACQAPINVQQTTVLNGVIETVDPTSRELLLRGNGGAQSGVLLTMVVSPRVQRLNELKPGDRVTVSYYQALAARMVTPLSGTTQPFQGMSIERNDTAQLPGGEITRVRSGRVVITAVDPAAGTVSFVGPGNIVRTVAPQNSEVQAFVRNLKVGDQVDIVYQEALAISVEPMK